MNESSRNTNYVDSSNYFCDAWVIDLDTGKVNPHVYTEVPQTNWRGWNWYRFMEPAGTKMIEYEHVKGMGDCSTQDPTYVVNPDYDSIQMGEEVDRTACMFNSQVFNQQNNPCFVPTHTLSDFFPSDKIPIKIKRCQDFFVYELPNIAQCDGRYCAI